MYYTIFFPPVAQQGNSALSRLIFQVYWSHRIRHMHKPGTIPLHEWSASRRGLYQYNTQQTQETNIHALLGIWTGDSGKQVAADRTATGIDTFIAHIKVA